MTAQSEGESGKHWISYGTERIDFNLSRKKRKTLAITVHPDLDVDVVAPMNAGEEAILNKVRKRARWILRQRRQFMSWMPKPTRRQYRGGETHRYLGRQYRLKIIKAVQRSVKLGGGFLVVRTPTPSDKKAVQKAVTQWFRLHAETRFAKQLGEAFARLRAYNLPEPTLRLRRMPKRWGSCTRSGEVILNPELVKTPTPCIEYVIVHELCHLRHPNHSRAFFRMLDAVLPDWRKRKERLERGEI